MEYESVILYKDIEGNVALDAYFEESDIPKLKEILPKYFGCRVEDVILHEESKLRGKPFTPNIPVVMKRTIHDIDWLNPEVIKEMLLFRGSNDKLRDKVLELSGRDPDKSKQTGFAVIVRYKYVVDAWEKWKRENDIVETKHNKSELVGEFVKPFIVQEEKKKLKRVDIGVPVFVPSWGEEGSKGTIKNYDEKDGAYDIYFDDGFSGKYKRKDFEVLGDLLFR
jgi:hypothetical protein